MIIDPYRFAAAGPSWTPDDWPELTGWYEAKNSTFVLTGSDVDEFQDLSGAGRTFFDYSGNKPVKTTRSGYDTVQFVEANNDELRSNATLANFCGASGMMAAAFELNGLPSASDPTVYFNNTILLDTAGYCGFLAKDNSGTAEIHSYVYSGGVKTTSPISVSINARHVAVMRWTGAGGTLYLSVDGGTEQSVSCGAPGSTAGLISMGSGYSTNWLNGYIYAAVFSTDPGTTDDVADLSTYLKNLIGI